MPSIQKEQLDLPRCPHCSIDKPNLVKSVTVDTKDYASQNTRHWVVYWCRTCGGCILTASLDGRGATITEQYPSGRRVADEIPERARELLNQSQASLHAPAGAVVLAAASVDAMLKAKGLTEGSLFARIDKAVADHVLTPEMGAWAHEIRLDANDQRHADMSVPLPSAEDASRVLEFALALAEYLFVLPARVSQNRHPTS